MEKKKKNTIITVNLQILQIYRYANFTGFHRFLRIKLIGNCNMGTQILESFKAFLVFSEQSVCIRQPNLAFLWFLPIFNFCCYY